MPNRRFLLLLLFSPLLVALSLSVVNEPPRKDISWIKRLTLKQCNKATAVVCGIERGAWSAKPTEEEEELAAPIREAGRQGRGETLKRVEVLPVSPREIDRGPQES